MEKIVIEQNNGEWKVSQGDRYQDHMTFDEMLGTIAAITMPRRRPCVHWLRTKEEHEAMWKKITGAKQTEDIVEGIKPLSE